MIDFIDMVTKKHQQEVARKLKQCLKNDKAKNNVSGISRFGLLEISRQRIQAPVEEGTYVPCAYCDGTGSVRSKESLALIILRKLQMLVAKGGIAEVEGELSTELADFLLNRKREEIVKMEKMHGVRIALIGKANLANSQYELNFTREEKSANGAKEVTPVMVQVSGHAAKKNGGDGDRSEKAKGKPQKVRKSKSLSSNT